MNIHAITQLPSVNSVAKIEALNALGIFTIRDMAEYDGCRHAEWVMGIFSQGNVEDASLENYIEASAITPTNLAALDQVDILSLISVNEADAQHLKTSFDVSTLAQLAAFPPHVEAQRIILESIRGTFYEKPSAPSALIPKLIGNTHTQVRFSNYVKEREYVFDDYALLHLSDADEPEPASDVIDIFYRSQVKFHLGYLAAIHQKWISNGTHLGEIIHSLALAPGESRNIAVLDWYRRQHSARNEDTTVAEYLRAEFTQTRALNEVVQTTATEHLYGSTSVDATTRTTGAGVVGGNASGAAAGGSASMDLMSMVGLPISLSGGGLASTANSMGGSLVYSNGSVQGTLKSETTGARSVDGELVQNIADATVQNASNVRSTMSTVVVEDVQRGRQRAQTSNVTNYNHSHALTVQYYEVLDSYRIDTGVDSLMPVLFLPFSPLTFTIALIKSYWFVFNNAIRQLKPGKAYEWNQVVKDFNPENDAFDSSGDLRIERVTITRTRSYSEVVRVELTDSDPPVTLALSAYDMDGSLEFEMTGSSSYVSYDILEDATLDQSRFGAADSFELDEGIKANLRSDFTSELKQVMKRYLDDESKTPKVADTNRDDNELGLGSNREALKEDVDNNLFSLLNTEQTVNLTIDIAYTVEDRNGQTQTVLQTIQKTYTYGQLKAEIDEQVADVTAHVNTQLATIADINPADTIAEIESYFTFHKYGFTKYLLANLEKEQVKDIIEHLGIYGSTETLALSALIDPSPLALTENMLIFKLKEDAAGLRRAIGQNFFSALNAPLFGKEATLSGTGLKQTAIRKGRETTKYRFWGQPITADAARGWSTANLTLYVDAKPNKADKHAVEGTVDLVQVIGKQQFTYPLVLTGTASPEQDNQIHVGYTLSGAFPSGPGEPQHGVLDWTFDFPESSGDDIAGIVLEYIGNLDEYERVVRRQHRWSNVFLPSSGVFAEAILGRSNASEYINMHRFFNWQDSPIPNLAPAIQAVNVNQDYAQPMPDGLTPTVPVSVLNQITPQQYPMPTSLTSALGAVQNGSMFTDMSKTTHFTTILGSLAELANNTAQLSGNLAGDAAANALNAAVALGQQVAGMVGTAMNTNVADPPQTLTSQGAVLEALDSIEASSNGGQISPIGLAQSGAVGAPIPTSTTPSSSNGTGGGSNGTNGGSTGSPLPVQTLTIGTITNDRVSPTKGQSDRYSIPRPGERNVFQRTFDVSFSKPADVAIVNVKADLLDGNGGLLQTVVDEAPGSTRVNLINDTTVRVEVTFGSSTSQIASTPPPTDQIRYRFTLRGQKSNGDTVESTPKESATYFALWRMPDGLSRFGTRDQGLDDWASQATYTWLDTNQSLVMRINDVSGEHGRDLGHATHFKGTDIDMFHVYTFPNGAASGSQNYLELKTAVQAALDGDAQALTEVNSWASDTRARFDSLIANADVEQVIYAIGSAVQAAGQPKLTHGWARDLLKHGTYTNPDGLSITLSAGAWGNANAPKMSYNANHNDHVHVTLGV